MKIFTGDKRIIKKEIEELLKLIDETKSKSLPIYQTTESLIYFYELLTNSKTDYFEILKKENYDEILKKKRIMENRKIQNIIATREVHEELIAFLSTYYGDEIYFSQYDDSEENKDLDEKEMYEIIKDFFQSHNKNAAFAFDFLIEEKRIFEMPNKDGLDNAYNLQNLYKNNFYLFIKKGDNIVTTMTDIVHEIGHTMDEIHMLSFGGHRRQKCNYYTVKSLLIETISLMYEKEFIDFLLEEGIYKDYAEQEMMGFFSSFQSYLEEMELLFCLPNDLLMKEEYKNISRQDFIEYLEGYCSITVDHEAIFNPRDIDLSADLGYCYGFAFSSYFNYLRRNDYSRYQENFRNFLKLRANYFPSDFLEKIGTNCKEFTNIVCASRDEFTSKIKMK